MMSDSTSKSLVIEATFLRIEGETCERCGISAESVREAVRALEKGLAPLEIPISYTEYEGTTQNVDDSNTVLINGRNIEEWLGGERVSTDCPSCSDLLGQPGTCCNATSINGTVYESFTADHVMTAALTALGLTPAPKGCGC